MERWRCDDCGREFGRVRQQHQCAPGLSVEEYFAQAQPWERPIFDRVAPHLASLGEVIVDPIDIGIQFKNGPVFCSLRAMKRWTALGFSLGRPITSERLSRKVMAYGGKYFHVINLDDADLVDDEVLGWLTEAYRFAGGDRTPVAAAGPDVDGAPGDPMVPDDVDDPFA